MLILAILLVATLGVQYYLNLLTQRENNYLREAQEQAIVAGIAVGISSLTSTDRIQELIDQPGKSFLDARSRDRIRDVVIIDEDWQITDAVNPDYLPTQSDDGTILYKKLQDINDLPPLMEGSRLGDDLEQFPNKQGLESVAADGNTGAATDSNKPPMTNAATDDEAHAVPIETSRGRWYVMVLLKSDRGKASLRAAQPLLYTLGVLLVSSLITLMLVWRFSRPIADLSNAAREIAEGNLGVRVAGVHRNDELGRLAENFNEMTAELEKKHDLEFQLQQAEKSAVVGRLGSAIAHEIRNPLNYINLTLDHLRSRFAPVEPERKAAFEKLTSQLKDEVARINEQISDFLNYSRPASVNLRAVDARQIIEDSLRLVEAQAEENDIKIGIVEHENVPKILGDPEFLRSVFNNLFINAVQAMGSSGGHLKVTISPDDDMVSIEIADTGNGIPAENLLKIFEPYFSTKETGTGLGLAIAFKIIEIHNGTIEVDSTVGEGTKFKIKLPKAED